MFFAGCATIPPPRALANLATPAPATGADRTAFNVSVYDNVWRWIDARYYDANFNGADWPAARERHRADAAAAKNDAELYAAINAMLDELHDRHTRAQPAEEFARSFRHLNIVLGWRSRELPGATDGRRLVTEVFPDSAAAAAGVRVGWTLLACDGRPPLEVVGPGKLTEGQQVRCDFLTERGEPRTLVLAGRRMAVPTYRAVREVAPEIFLLRFDGFDMPSAHWVREQVTAHAKAKALIFDLRGNPGGHVFALASILGDVFPRPVDLGQLVHRGHVAWWHHLLLQRGGPRYGGKIAVLTSEGTTSAAEIFSQLVQENGRGIIVGQKTGAALLTSVFWPLAGGGKLWLSVYDYHSPKGSRVEGRGVIPDVAVPVPETPSADENDPVVRAALDALAREARAGALPAKSAN
ncbi:MAG TPA: S41 family peptidase [Opitutaceae bacterium]|nr:S41 family peptidase [Opitutaceae bacterium]